MVSLDLSTIQQADANRSSETGVSSGSKRISFGIFGSDQDPPSGSACVQPLLLTSQSGVVMSHSLKRTRQRALQLVLMVFQIESRLAAT